MKVKHLTIIACVLVFLITVISGAYGLKGSIGNARIVVNTEVAPGETTYVDRTIKVNNQNNVSVSVEVIAFDVLKDITTVYDDEFILQPGETKHARFRIAITEPGMLEGDIGVAFSPADPTDRSAGAGLQSHITIYTALDNSTAPITPERTDKQEIKKSAGSSLVGIGLVAIIVIIGVIVYLLATKKIK